MKHFEFWAFVAFALALAWFGFSSVAHATTVEQTLNTSASAYTNNFRQALNTTMDSGGDPETKTFDLSGTISSITFRVDPDENTDQINTSLIHTAVPCTATSTWTTLIEEGYVGFSGNLEQDVGFSFAPQTLVSGRCYALLLNLIPANPVRGAIGNPWSFGNTYSDAGISETFDAYFITNASFTAGDSVSITSPANGATSTRTSALWTADVNRATSTDTYGVTIRYSSTSSIPASTSGTLGGLVFDATDGSNTATNYLFLEASTTYYARAFLQHESGSIVASSSVISFSTGVSAGGASGSWASPTSTATSSEWVITCDPNSSFFVNSLCNLALALFIPKTSDLERFNTLYTDIESKPPIGYFTLVKNSINSLSTSTTSTFALADLSSMEGTLLSPIKNGVSIVLWFVFIFWAFHRFRHFEL